MVETLEQLLDLSKEILEAANQAQWAKVEALQQQRTTLIEKINQQPLPSDRDASLKAEALINAIQALDGQTLPLLNAEQDATRKARQKSNKGKQMSQAYRSLNR